MSRPAKPVAVNYKKMSKTEKEIRENVEKNLTGSTNKLRPSSYLTTNQKKIFKYILNELRIVGTVGNLDVYILNQTAVTLDRLIETEKFLNEHPAEIHKSSVINNRSKLMNDFFKCCAELCLSPAARAKMGMLVLTNIKDHEDTLISALKEGGVL